MPKAICLKKLKGGIKNLDITLCVWYDIRNSREENTMMSPITSKKQSQAKSNWMKENSKIFSVRVMKNTEADIYNYLTAQEKPTTVIKEAIKEYMVNHPEESDIPWEEQI